MIYRRNPTHGERLMKKILFFLLIVCSLRAQDIPAIVALVENENMNGSAIVSYKSLDSDGETLFENFPSYYTGDFAFHSSTGRFVSFFHGTGYKELKFPSSGRYFICGTISGGLSGFGKDTYAGSAETPRIAAFSEDASRMYCTYAEGYTHSVLFQYDFDKRSGQKVKYQLIKGSAQATLFAVSTDDKNLAIVYDVPDVNQATLYSAPFDILQAPTKLLDAKGIQQILFVGSTVYAITSNPQGGTSKFTLLAVDAVTKQSQEIFQFKDGGLRADGSRGSFRFKEKSFHYDKTGNTLWLLDTPDGDSEGPSDLVRLDLAGSKSQVVAKKVSCLGGVSKDGRFVLFATHEFSDSGAGIAVIDRNSGKTYFKKTDSRRIKSISFVESK